MKVKRDREGRCVKDNVMPVVMICKALHTGTRVGWRRMLPRETLPSWGDSMGKPRQQASKSIPLRESAISLETRLREKDWK